MRLALGLTTSELSEKIGVGANYISIMESGKRVVSELQSRKITELLIETARNDDACFAELKMIFRIRSTIFYNRANNLFIAKIK